MAPHERSAADRRLASQGKLSRRGLSTRRAGTLLKQQIPMCIFQEWKQTQASLTSSGLGGPLWCMASSPICLCQQFNRSLLQQVVATSRTPRLPFLSLFEEEQAVPVP